MIIVFITTSCSDGYNKFPKNFRNRETLIKAIHPNRDYVYWEYCHGFFDSGKIIYSSGKKPVNLVFKDPGGGVFAGCAPSCCYEYVAYVSEGNVLYVTNKKEFTTFLGTIDNLKEAVLLAEVNGHVWVDDNKKGGAYSQKDTTYNLKMEKYMPCPETKESIYFPIGKHAGIIKKNNLGAYYNGHTCIVY